MILCAIFDKKVQEYMPPMAFPNRVTAIRSLSAAIKPGSNLSTYPHDFVMYEIGTFNGADGSITPTVPPSFVEEVANLVNPNQENK